MSVNALFSPGRLGAIGLPHRIIMAPLTRMRADEHGAQGPLNAEYYAQRASASLIITEATVISARAPLNPYDRTTFYGGGARGYTDYPVLEAVAQRS